MTRDRIRAQSRLDEMAQVAGPRDLQRLADAIGVNRSTMRRCPERRAIVQAIAEKCIGVSCRHGAIMAAANFRRLRATFAALDRRRDVSTGRHAYAPCGLSLSCSRHDHIVPTP